MYSNSNKINDDIEVFIMDSFKIEGNNQINQNNIARFIDEKKINLVITTRPSEQLEFIQESPPIIVVSELNDTYDVSDHQKIIDENDRIQRRNIKGNFLYIIDNYTTMLKYIFSLELELHYTLDFHNLKQDTVKEIYAMDLVEFFQAHKHYLTTQIGPYQQPELPPNVIQQINLPSPIRIPIFQMANQNQKN
ncbi:unnamed protein product [Paramecium sonneborni]|uniref:Uncharacterized protein n=1 Tax=Paramecium sonneborni TaxID=65129 RepID=A0A8S1RAB8_9CILI|nr:unnamed protein product [Paramecium sonneborni]